MATTVRFGAHVDESRDGIVVWSARVAMEVALLGRDVLLVQ
jgi:hypothetical protein